MYFIQFLLVWLSVSLQSHLTDTNYQFKTEIEKAFISGQIFDASNELISIELLDPVRFENQKFVDLIDESGWFKIEFDIRLKQDVVIAMNDTSLTLIVGPGDSIVVNVADTGIFIKDGKTGQKLHGNEVLNQFLIKYKNFISEWQLSNQERKLISPENYKKHFFDLEKKSLDFLDKYYLSNNVSPELRSWMSDYVVFYLLNPLMKKFSVQQNIPQEFWSFLTQYRKFKLDDILCSEYLKFQISNLVLINNTNKYFEGINQAYGNWPEYYSNTLNAISKSTRGLDREFLLSLMLNRCIDEDFDAGVSLYKIYKSHAENEWFEDQFMEIMNKRSKMLSEFSNVFTLYDFRNSKDQMDIFELISERYKGKVVYIDNWANWCGPCISEMPTYEVIFKKYSEKDVEFVFLCWPDNFETERAYSIIAEYGIEGDHYFLNHFMQLQIQNEYNFNTIPRYFIMGKNGEILTSDAPKPSQWVELNIALRKALVGN